MLSSINAIATTSFLITSVDIDVRTHLKGNDMECIEQRDAPYVRCVITNKLIVAIIENNGRETRYRSVKG